MAKLEDKARWVRKQILKMAITAGSGHIAPSLSCVEILVALYHILTIDPMRPHWPDRDRLILSKGHASLALYSVLADMGYFPKNWLGEYNLPGGRLGGMTCPDVPGVELSTGALAHGLSVGAGMALSAKLDGKEWKVYVILGDGECQEGSVWEAAMFAAHHKLDNLIAIIDRNNLQALDFTEDVMRLEPLLGKWSSFGWHTETADGHNVEELIGKIDRIWLRAKDKPSVVVAHTIKGKGLSFMENKAIWHYRVPSGTDYLIAQKELANKNCKVEKKGGT